MECSDLARTGVAGPRPLPHHQHRPPPGQRDVRGGQLVRRRRGRVRRDGLRRHPLPRRAADAARSPRTSTWRSSPTPGRSTTRASRRAPSTSAGRRSRPASTRSSIARNVFDSNNIGRLRLFGAVLGSVELDDVGPPRRHLPRSRDGPRGRRHLRRHRGADQPAAHREGDPGGRLLQGVGRRTSTAISLRSKGAIDVGEVAKQFGGGGHKNASGCTVAGEPGVGPPAGHAPRPGGHRARDRDGDGRSRRLTWTASSSSTSPKGPTSHDVVARARRALRIRSDRPHRHARPDGHRRAGARRRPRHPPGAVPVRATGRRTTRSPGSAWSPTRGTAPARRSPAARRRRCRRSPTSSAPSRGFLGTGPQRARLPTRRRRSTASAPTCWRDAAAPVDVEPAVGGAARGARDWRSTCPLVRLVAAHVGRLLRALAGPRTGTAARLRGLPGGAAADGQRRVRPRRRRSALDELERDPGRRQPPVRADGRRCCPELPAVVLDEDGGAAGRTRQRDRRRPGRRAGAAAEAVRLLATGRTACWRSPGRRAGRAFCIRPWS